MASRQRYQWEPDRGRYRDTRTGRFVSALKVRQVIDATLRNLRADVRRMTDDVRAGRLSKEAWALEMRQAVRDVHLFSSAAANGGFANMGQDAYRQVEAAIAEQTAFLDAFTQDVLSGEQPLDGRFTQRATMYVEAGRTTYERAHRDIEQGRGMTEERNVLHDAAEHCGECPELSEREWVPIGTLPLPGQRECVTGCLCLIETR
jgi:hypothetical protein